MKKAGKVPFSVESKVQFTKKGSILAYSLVILTMMLAIAIGLSKSTIVEKRQAGVTEFSTQAIQTADGGLQYALKTINDAIKTDDGTEKINIKFAQCASSASDNPVSYVTGGEFKLSFYEDDGCSNNKIDPAGCATKEIKDIACVKSVGSYEKTVRAVSMTLSKNTERLYVTDNNGGGQGDFLTFDVSDPLNPVKKATLSGIINDPRHIAIYKDRAYVTSQSQNRIKIIDISNRNNPVEIPSAILAGALDSPDGIAVAGAYLYVANSGNHTLSIYKDLDTWPDNPTYVDSFDIGGSDPYGLAVSGNYLYTADLSDNNIRVFDISNPEVIGTPVGNVDTGKKHGGLAIYEDYLYVTNTDPSDNNFSVYDIETKDNPSFVRDVSLPEAGYNKPYGVAVYENYLYVSTYFTGQDTVFIYNLDPDPKNPSDTGKKIEESEFTNPFGIIGN